MVEQTIMPPPEPVGKIFLNGIYFSSLWIIPLAILSFFFYKVFRREDFSNTKKFVIILIFLVIYSLFGIGHTFFMADNNFFQELNHSVSDAFSIAFLWPSIYGNFLFGAQIIGGVLLILITWLSFWIGNKLFD